MEFDKITIPGPLLPSIPQKTYIWRIKLGLQCFFYKGFNLLMCIKYLSELISVRFSNIGARLCLFTWGMRAGAVVPAPRGLAAMPCPHPFWFRGRQDIVEIMNILMTIQ